MSDGHRLVRTMKVRTVLVRDVPEEVVVAIDSHAAALRLSRSEYLRRRLQQEAQIGAQKVTVADLQRMGRVFADLADPEVMTAAWS